MIHKLYIFTLNFYLKVIKKKVHYLYFYHGGRIFTMKTISNSFRPCQRALESYQRDSKHALNRNGG